MASCRGVQEIFKLLPHEMVSIEDLPKLVGDGSAADLKKVYGVVARNYDIVAPRDGSPMSQAKVPEYYERPDEFRSVFAETILPYTSVLMNCLFWTERFPRIVTTKQLEDLIARGESRMLAVGDISCDLRGSVEFLTEFTSIEQPFYLYDAKAALVHHNLDDQGVMIMANDILPAELPADATAHFGDALLPFLPQLVTSDGVYHSTVKQKSLRLKYTLQLSLIRESLHRATNILPTCAFRTSGLPG